MAALTQQYKGAIFSLQKGIWLHLATQLSFLVLANSIISYLGEAHRCQCQLRSPQSCFPTHAGAPFVPRTATVKAAHKPPWSICLDLCGSALDLPQDDQWALLDHGMGAHCHLTQHIPPTSCLQSQALSSQGIQKYWARALPWFCSVGKRASVEAVCEVRVVMQQCV